MAAVVGDDGEAGREVGEDMVVLAAMATGPGDEDEEGPGAKGPEVDGAAFRLDGGVGGIGRHQGGHGYRGGETGG